MEPDIDLPLLLRHNFLMLLTLITVDRFDGFATASDPLAESAENRLDLVSELPRGGD